MTKKYLDLDGLKNFWEKLVIFINKHLSLKQDTLVSGTNIKTINSESILGDGELSVGTITTVDANEYVDDVETTEITSAILEGFIPLSRDFSDDFNNDFAR